LGEAFPALTASGGIHATTGAAETIAAVTDAIGYHFAYDERIGQYAHVAAVALLTADGRLARWLYGVTQDPTDLHLALTEAGRGEIGGWTDQLLLLCLTVLGLGGFVVLAVRRDRRSASERSGSGPA
jgi:protein SCO1/2